MLDISPYPRNVAELLLDHPASYVTFSAADRRFPPVAYFNGAFTNDNTKGITANKGKGFGRKKA
jgi:hypothetical protein